MIRESEHFIYIENQFFISNPGREDTIVKNRIAMEIKNRIIKAHHKGTRFMVIVVIPLLPGFSGDITNQAKTVLRAQVRYQQQSIAKDKFSLFSQLKTEGILAEDYIRFYALRNHGVLNDKPVQEIIYVHSKFMIVDDRRFIIGSSNINDRSMLGDRDSEIGIVVEEGMFKA